MSTPRDFEYARQKLDQARSSLMGPNGADADAGRFADAFLMISPLMPEDVADLPEPASDYWAKISRFMDTSGLVDPDDRGLNAVRAAAMSHDERLEFARNVDELASWLSDRIVTPEAALEAPRAAVPSLPKTVKSTNERLAELERRIADIERRLPS